MMSRHSCLIAYLALLLLWIVVPSYSENPTQETDGSGNPSNFDNYHIGWVWPDSLPRLHSEMAMDAKGRIYVSSDDGILFCLNENGTIIWAFNSECESISAPFVNDSTIFIAGTNDRFINRYRHLFALDFEGNSKWVFTGDEWFDDRLFFYEGKIYMKMLSENNNSGAICIDREGKSESIYWPNSLNPVELIGINANDHLILWQSGPERNFCVYSKKGMFVGNYPQTNRRLTDNTPIMSIDRIFYSSDSALFISLNSRCDTLWTYGEQKGGVDDLTCVEIVQDSAVFLGTEKGMIYKLGRFDGSLYWTIDLGDDFGEIIRLQAAGHQNLMVSGSSNSIAIIDSSGNLTDSYKMTENNRLGKPLLTMDNEILVIQEGVLFKLTKDQKQKITLENLFPEPPPVDLANQEITDFILRYIASDIEELRESVEKRHKDADSIKSYFPKSKLILYSPVGENGISDLRMDKTTDMWVYEDGKMNEVANKDETFKKYSDAIDKNPYRSVIIGYYAFGVDITNDDTREAVVYLEYYCGFLCAHGERFQLYRSPSGKWRISKKELIWIS